MAVEGLNGFGEDQINPWKSNLLKIREYEEITLCTGSVGTAGCWRLQSCPRGGYGYSCQHNEPRRMNCSGPALSQGCCWGQSSELQRTLCPSTMAGSAWIRDWGGFHLLPASSVNPELGLSPPARLGPCGSMLSQKILQDAHRRDAMCSGNMKSRMLPCCLQAKLHTFAHPMSHVEVITGLRYLQLQATS